MPDAATPLAGRGVLVTRPAHQSEGLQRILMRMGARVFRQSLLRIAPALKPNLAQELLASIEDNEIVIVASANAVRAALALRPDLASHLQQPLVACLGVATAKALQGVGVDVNIVPESGNTSEDLLAVEQLNSSLVSGRTVAIIKGEGGRRILAQTLTDRGADVQLINVYRREPAGLGIAALLDDNRGAIDIAIVTSGESLSRLHEVAGLERIKELALVLPSQRVLKQARTLGLGGPFFVSRQVNDAELARSAARLVAQFKVTGEA